MFLVLVSGGLFRIQNFVDFRDQESGFNVEMVGVEFVPSGVGKKESDSRGFWNRSEGVVIVLAFLLGETTSHPSRFVAWSRGFRIFDLENEFGGDDIVVLGSRYDGENAVFEL